ncbi:MAG: carbon-nitrogen hydrolase family protein [Candidatus Sedimenticola sp. (ex Thyasira tokunagai)]
MVTVACIQMRSGCDIEDNIKVVSSLIRDAAHEGVDFIATPEMTSLLDKKPGAILLKAKQVEHDMALSSLRELAVEMAVYLLIGSLPILISRNHCVNRSFLISDKGEIISYYDKIHMFDVDLGSGQSFKESLTYIPGNQCVVAQACGVPIGMTICYDLRFPNLYQDLAKAGAKILAVPSAFTKLTGQAHWHVLLRARAIETGCFVIAPAQVGIHEDGRETYGHSVIINPWGEIMTEIKYDVGYILANLELSEVEEARRRIPSLYSTVAYQASANRY